MILPFTIEGDRVISMGKTCFLIHHDKENWKWTVYSPLKEIRIEIHRAIGHNPAWGDFSFGLWVNFFPVTLSRWLEFSFPETGICFCTGEKNSLQIAAFLLDLELDFSKPIPLDKQKELQGTYGGSWWDRDLIEPNQDEL